MKCRTKTGGRSVLPGYNGTTRISVETHLYISTASQVKFDSHKHKSVFIVWIRDRKDTSSMLIISLQASMLKAVNERTQRKELYVNLPDKTTVGAPYQCKDTVGCGFNVCCKNDNVLYGQNVISWETEVFWSCISKLKMKVDSWTTVFQWKQNIVPWKMCVRQAICVLTFVWAGDAWLCEAALKLICRDLSILSEDTDKQGNTTSQHKSSHDTQHACWALAVNYS